MELPAVKAVTLRFLKFFCNTKKAFFLRVLLDKPPDIETLGDISCLVALSIVPTQVVYLSKKVWILGLAQCRGTQIKF